MTFCVAGHWLAVPVEQMDRIAFAERLWPVPLARPEHRGLMDDGGELIPVLDLRANLDERHDSGLLVAVLHVRGENVGLAVDSPGRVHDRFHLLPDGDEPPALFSDAAIRRADADDTCFWLIDPDKLWSTRATEATTLPPSV